MHEHPEANPLIREVAATVAKYWWVELVIGAFWVVIALVILKFNHASVVTVGLLIGIMLLVFAVEELALAALSTGWIRWMWAFFGVLLAVGGILALIHPRNTFAAFADILGFIFLLIGVIWLVQAFVEREYNQLWWLGLTAGILMVILAFWVDGEFFLSRASTLLVFAGIWGLMKGVTDIIRAFQLRALAPQ